MDRHNSVSGSRQGPGSFAFALQSALSDWDCKIFTTITTTLATLTGLVLEHMRQDCKFSVLQWPLFRGVFLRVGRNHQFIKGIQKYKRDNRSSSNTQTKKHWPKCVLGSLKSFQKHIIKKKTCKSFYSVCPPLPSAERTFKEEVRHKSLCLPGLTTLR